MDRSICSEYIVHLNNKILNREPVYKTQCQITFKNAFSRNGLYVNLKNLDAYCEDYLEWNSSLTGCRLYLNIQGSKEFHVENVKNPTNISIEKEGGYSFDGNVIKELYTYKVVEMPSKKCFELGDDNIPSELEEKLKYIIQYDSNNDIVGGRDSSSEVSSWSEERKMSKHANNLFQTNDSKKIPSSGWKCEKCGAMSNLWLNLSDGYIGCGRKLYGIGGGCFDGKEEGAALLHYKEYPERPLVVKLGTITQFGVADVFSYDPDEDDLVLDPNLTKHLSTFGINVGVLEKTEKNLTELQIEHNNKLDFRNSDENGYNSNGVAQYLVPLEKVGIRQYFVGIENAGNTCYINVILQFLSGVPEVKKLFVEHFDDIIDIYSNHLFKKSTPRNDIIVQFSKVINALVSNDVYIDRKYKIDNCILNVQNAKNKLKENNINDNIIESIFGTETDYNYVNILPLVFKKAVSHGNPEFSSSHQQDTQEYFSFLIDKLREKLQIFLQLSIEKDNKLVDPIKDFLGLFSFTHIERLECKQTGKVKLIKSNNNFISLSIPSHLYSAPNSVEIKQFQSSHRVSKKQRQDGPDVIEDEDSQNDVISSDTLSSPPNNTNNALCTNELCMESNEDETINQKPIDLNLLLRNWNSEEIIDSFLSPCTNTVGKAGKTNYLKTMPKYLTIQIKRFYLSHDWKPQKITASVEAPEFLDIEPLRRSDSLYNNESPFPDDTQFDNSDSSCHSSGVDGTRQCGESQHTIPEPLLTAVLDLGFTKDHAKLAVKNTGTMDLNTCIDWILCNSNNLELSSGSLASHVENVGASLESNDKCSETKINKGNSFDDLNEDTVQDVIAICCCSRIIALRALKISNGDVERAIQIIFDDPLMVENFQSGGEECKGEEVLGNGASLTDTSYSLGELNVESDGEGKYELVAVICHLGNSVHSGHYICYLKRSLCLKEGDIQEGSELTVGENSRWFKFNDSRISLCKGSDLLQKESGYIYIYRRI